MNQNEQWTQHDIDVANTPDTSLPDWDEEALVESQDSAVVSSDDFFIGDEYCWMHTPGGWSCVECRQVSK